jgi:hypothetical protein
MGEQWSQIHSHKNKKIVIAQLRMMSEVDKFLKKSGG